MHGLDVDQQVAFEILASTYVLTFHYDAKQDLFGSDFDDLEKQIMNLKQFARQPPHSAKPLRLFVTGPAGAGKCKQAFQNAFYSTKNSQMFSTPHSNFAGHCFGLFESIQ